ncbi:HlyD family type I secretion periplasmic adaptor subunit [Pyruvatibacter sp. HU-CL02332]|uniref:HlyD family type I secretion periplasmic adaptor subunit n=1 Tax=Pyruvatibacter sp. HU-CL02332 TaxID=3127650 RepID=UPI00310645AE
MKEMIEQLIERLRALVAPVEAETGELDGNLRGPSIIGAAFVFAFFGVFGGWAAFVPLAGGAIAPGIVSPDGSLKTVQHLEGGIIRELLVKDGDRVAEGDPVVVLEETQAKANFEVLNGQRRSFAAAQARLEAEQVDAEDISFPAWLTAEAQSEPAAQKVIDSETAIFMSRRETQSGTSQILGQRVAQLREEINGFEQQILSDEVQVDLIGQEISSVKTLVRKGLERKPRLLGLQRRQAEISSAMSGRKASIARAQQQIGETEIRITTARSQFLDEVAGQLSEVRTRLASVEEEIEARRDVLDRTVISAPVSGVVVGRRFSTAGGVVRPGDTILDIVPDGGNLQIDARISPTDIDIVHTGLTAKVHLLSFSQRALPAIDGTVQTVSADSLEDDRTGERYYKAQVLIDAKHLAEAGDDIQLTPGMPADVLIVTGERTLLSYLSQPLRDSFRRSFREE